MESSKRRSIFLSLNYCFFSKKLCTKIIYILLQTSVLLIQIYYQKKSFLTTPNIENKFRSSAEFQWIHFLKLWLEILVGVIRDNYLHL